MFRRIVVSKQLTKSFSTASDVYALSLLPKEEVTTRVLKTVRSVKFAPQNASEKSYLVADLGFDSFLRKDFVEKLSEEFAVPIPSEVASNIVSVKDAIEYIATLPKAR